LYHGKHCLKQLAALLNGGQELQHDAFPPEMVPNADRRSFTWFPRILLVLFAGSALYCWCRVLSIWIPFGGHSTIVRWVALGIVSLAALVALGAWHSRSSRSAAMSARGFWLLALVWTAAGALLWYWLSSPFSRDPSIAAGFSTTSWWLLWLGLMIFIPWRWPIRLATLAGLWILVVGFVLAVRVDGLDGDAKPRIVWRAGAAKTLVNPVQATAPASSSPADDETAEYPRFRGADGLATVRDVKLARDWSQRKPVLKWRIAMGAAWSGFAIAGSHALTQEQREEAECVTCYERHSGREVWVHRDSAHYQFPSTGDGPRATPTVDGQFVYTLGATGILNCLDRETGVGHWTVNILTDNDAKSPPHGMCGSPLVVGEIVVVSAGGSEGRSLVAYDKHDGHRVWRAGNDPASYASPFMMEISGAQQILVVNTQTFNGHDPISGELLWTVAWKNDTDTNCSQPFPVLENRVFVSTDYGTGCALFEVATAAEGSWMIEPVWTKRTMQTKFSSAVVHDGHAFGLDDGILECVSLEDGRRRWKKGRYGHGQLLIAGDLLVIQAEDGRVALVEANPATYRELAELQAIEGKTWNNPALAGRQLFVRNDREAACYELPLEAD